MRRYEEAALAAAQAWIQDAIDKSGVHERVIAHRLRRTQKYLQQIRCGEYDGLTIAEVAHILNACGFRFVMGIQKLATNEDASK